MCRWWPAADFLLGCTLPHSALEQQAPVAIHAPLQQTTPIIDGRIHDAEWQGARTFTLDHQVLPGDNTRPTEDTTVLVAYTTDHLLLAIRATDSDAAGGYEVEIAIPFRSLRFAGGDVRTWGLHVQRWIARKAERISWQPQSREATSLLTQMGTLTGLSAIRTQRPLDLIPTLTASAVTIPAPDDTRTTREASPGVTATWQVTPNAAISAAVNPDFSQVEADVPQIDVNQRFPPFYAEKRPFFLEGGQYFRSPGALTFVNTRQIVDPDWGVRLAGKVGSNTVAALSARDRNGAVFHLARYQRDLGANSTIGAFLTERRLAGSVNRVLALDGQIRFSKQTIGFQAGRSTTDVPEPHEHPDDPSPRCARHRRVQLTIPAARPQWALQLHTTPQHIHLRGIFGSAHRPGRRRARPSARQLRQTAADALRQSRLWLAGRVRRNPGLEPPADSPTPPLNGRTITPEGLAAGASDTAQPYTQGCMHDTSPDMEALHLAGWRKMSSVELAGTLNAAWRAGRQIALIALRERYPQADESEIRVRLAVQTLGVELAARIHPDAARFSESSRRG